MIKEKEFTAQTVRIPKSIEKALGHLMVETGESFQSLSLRLLRRELDGPASQDAGSQATAASISDNGDAPWPRDVRDGDELVREFVAMLKHPGPHDQMGKGGMRQHIIDHLRHAGFREERRKAKEGERPK